MKQITNLKGYRHLSFDLWLTLIKSNPEYKPNRNLLFREFFAIDEPLEEVSAAIRKFDVLTNAINEKVTRNFDTFEIWYLILDHLGIGPDKFSNDDLSDFYLETEKLLMRFPPMLLDQDFPSFLQKISSEGISTNILSNTAFIKGRSLRKVLDHHGVGELFSFQAYSDETGFSKPGKPMFDHAFNMMQQFGITDKTQVLHIGDNAFADVAGAKNYGFHAHLFTNSITNEPTLQPS